MSKKVFYTINTRRNSFGIFGTEYFVIYISILIYTRYQFSES